MPASTTIAEIFGHTPFWVWLVLVLVVTLGLQRTRDRAVSLGRLVFLPLLIVLLALSSISTAPLANLPAFLVGAVAGGVAGWLLEPVEASRRLPDGRIWLRGEWLSLIQVVAVFTFRYATGAIAATQPGLATAPVYQMLSLFVTAALAALFAGRTAARLAAYATTPATA